MIRGTEATKKIKELLGPSSSHPGREYERTSPGYRRPQPHVREYKDPGAQQACAAGPLPTNRRTTLPCYRAFELPTVEPTTLGMKPVVRVATIEHVCHTCISKPVPFYKSVLLQSPSQKKYCIKTGKTSHVLY